MKINQAIEKSVKSYIAHSTVSQTPSCFPVHVTCFCKYKCVCIGGGCWYGYLAWVVYDIWCLLFMV